MDNNDIPGLSLDGAQFRKAISDAVESSAIRTLDGIRTALNNAHKAFIEAHPDATVEERADDAMAAKIKFIQFQYCVSDVLMNFVEAFATNLTNLASPKDAVISASTGERPLDQLTEAVPSNEPSWKKLHDIIGYKSAEAK